MMRVTRRSVLAMMATLATPAVAGTRPAEWAQPVAVDGAPNLYRITPLLYRAAQPTAAGFRALTDLGVKTVISMRQTVDDAPLAAGTGLVLHRVPMKSRFVGEDDGARIVAVLRLIEGSMAAGPVLFHCHHGADRTGAVCAVYRMVYQGWTHQAALDELLSGGYGFHTLWRNIPRYVAGLDVEGVRAAVEG
jgi:protein tyrosine/serine phosphatase